MAASIVCSLLLLGLHLSLAEEVTFYNAKVKFCCDGNTFFRKDFMDAAVVTCCAGQVRNYTAAEVEKKVAMHECCGDNYYDPRQYDCVNETLIKLKDDDVADGRLKVCPGYDDGGQPKTYDEEKKFCCGGGVYPIDFTSDCCGGKAYSRAKKVCCPKVAPEPSTEEAKDETELLDLPEGLLFSDALCCNGQVIDKKKQVCCSDGAKNLDGAVADECCGESTFYNSSSHWCVKGELVAKEEHKQLCGDAIYDTRLQTCGFLDQKLYDTDESKGEELCDGAFAVYNEKSQGCCGLEVKDKPSEDAEANRNDCCFDGLFDFIKNT